MKSYIPITILAASIILSLLFANRCFKKTMDDERHRLMHEKARKLFLKKGYKKSIKYLNKCIKRNYDEYLVLNEIGYILLTVEIPEQAIEYFEKTATIIPFDALPFNNISAAYNQIGDYEKALSHAKRSISIYPKMFTAWANKADALWALEKYEDALEAFKKAISLNPNYEFGNYAMGCLLFQLEKYDESFEYLKSIWNQTQRA